LLLSLPPYKFDYPSFAPPFAEDGTSRATRQSVNKIRSATATVPVQWFSTEALDKAIATGQPALFKIRNFNKEHTLDRLFQFASHDKHTFCTVNGSHRSDGLKLSAVLDNRNTKNLHRIEDGIYPERVLPTMHPTEMLNQALPESHLLTAWLVILSITAQNMLTHFFLSVTAQKMITPWFLPHAGPQPHSLSHRKAPGHAGRERGASLPPTWRTLPEQSRGVCLPGRCAHVSS
jgi:hypothetical protein